jgi:hypothetical protein
MVTTPNVNNQVPSPTSTLPSLTKVAVFRFKFLDLVFSLLHNLSIFGDIKNLVVNQPSSPDCGDPCFCPYVPRPPPPYVPTDFQRARYNEMLTGDWYHDTCIRLGICPGIDLLIPVLIYLDKTGTDMNQRYSLEPIIIMLAIIAMHKHSLEKAWRVLGYITDLKVSSKAKRKMETTGQAKGRSSRKNAIV